MRSLCRLRLRNRKTKPSSRRSRLRFVQPGRKRLHRRLRSRRRRSPVPSLRCSLGPFRLSRRRSHPIRPSRFPRRRRFCFARLLLHRPSHEPNHLPPPYLGTSRPKIRRHLRTPPRTPRMKIAFVVPANRDEVGQFELLAPVFGPAPQALLDGFAQLPNCEIHVISTTRQVTANPQKLAPNIFFHSLKLSPWSRLRTLNAGSTQIGRAHV